MNDEQVDDKRIIETLARESKEPVEEVARLYYRARSDLAAGARVLSFVPIFVIRNVQETLHRRSRARRAAALAAEVISSS